MTITSTGLSGAAISIGSYTASWYVAVGTGSASVSASRSGLITEFDRNLITGSVDFTTLNKISMTVDFSSLELSGATIKEFGVFAASSGNKAFQVEGFTGVAFDGSQEAQITTTWRVF